MELIKIHDKTFEQYISAQQLEEINARMAAEVYQDLGECLLLSLMVHLCLLPTF